MHHLGRSLNSPGGILVLSLLVAGILFFPTVRELYLRWTAENDPTYSHGILLLAVSGYFLYNAWKESAQRVRIEVNRTGLAILAALSVFWFLAFLAAINIVQSIILLLILMALLWTLFGRSAPMRMYFPVALLFFALPFWGVLHPILRSVVTPAVVGLLELSSITAIQDGYRIAVSEGTFFVDKGCSGLRFLLVAIILALVYAHMTRKHLTATLALAGIAAVISVITNVFRIYMVIMAGQLTKMQHYFVTDEHVTVGWVLFGIVFTIFFFFVIKFDKQPPRSPDGNGLGERERRKAHLSYVGLVAVVLAVGPALGLFYTRVGLNNYAIERLHFVDHAGEWRRVQHAQSDALRPQFKGAEQELYTAFRRGEEETINVYVAKYGVQAQGREAVNDTNRLYSQEDGFEVVTKKRVRVEGGQLTELTVVDKYGQRYKIISWYEVLGRKTSGRYLTKALSLVSMLILDPEVSVYVVSYAERVVDQPSAVVKILSEAVEKSE